MITFQQFINRLSAFWEKQGCILHQGYDLEVGAGTFNPATFLRSLGPEPYRAAYIEPCRRPADGRYGTNPNRLQHYFQYQVILKPSPDNIQELYLQSLEALGFDLKKHDIRFVHDDWENPTIGAWGLGWEVWMDGMEITQFTYFQSVAGVDLKPITGEITYGIERLAMYLQNIDSIFDLQWNEDLTYGDIYHRNEVEWSHYNFEKASTAMWQRHFEDYEKEAKKLIGDLLPIPAYDFVMKASHAFNIMDARGAISVTERTGYIGRIRDLARQIAESYITSREKQGFPLLSRTKTREKLPPSSPEPQMSEKLLNVHPGSKADFLLEIGSEELPAGFVAIGIQNLERQIRALLENEAIEFERISLYSTPRRLAVVVHQMAMGKPSQTIEKKGPSLDQAYSTEGDIRPAGEGFFRTLGIPSPKLETLKSGGVSGLEIRSIKGTSYLFGSLHAEGRATAAILQEKLPAIILNLEFPKKMRWGDVDISYARPLHWIISLLGEEIVPFRVGPVEAGRLTFGHRQLAPQPFSIANVKDYVKTLSDHFVMADSNLRKQSIQNQLDALEKEHQVKIIQRERVIPEVLNLIEWPHLSFASFREEFLRAPKEVLISEMVEHQKYFPVTDPGGRLKNLFILTANVPPTDPIRKGNERVLSARLSDGVFLYEEDLKIPLDHFNEKLKKVTFQKELGTVHEKVERLAAHAQTLQKMLSISTPARAERAAFLCKADLASHMVYEFPELQGTMGTYYALAAGEDSEVAKAIDEHWMPRGENAPLPQTETGTVISLSDKIDNLLGFFAIGLKPTSSSDPYALRRQVLGLIKILINGKYELSLRSCLQECAAHFPPTLMQKSQEVIEDILGFITNRVKTVFQDYGFNKDEIEGCLAYGCNDIYDTYCRVKALHEFRKHSSAEFHSLYEVYKRAKGQLNGSSNGIVDQSFLIEPVEKKLYALLESQKGVFQETLAMRDYDRSYALIAAIQSPLADLFEQVKILADDPKIRDNRLALLRRVFNLFGEILDFSKIQE